MRLLQATDHINYHQSILLFLLSLCDIVVQRGIPIQYNMVWYHAQQSLDYGSLIVPVMCIARVKLHTFCQYTLTNRESLNFPTKRQLFFHNRQADDCDGGDVQIIIDTRLQPSAPRGDEEENKTTYIIRDGDRRGRRTNYK